MKLCDIMDREKAVTVIQKTWRMHTIFKKMRKPNDNFSMNLLFEQVDLYISLLKNTLKVNKLLREGNPKAKIMRNVNFPSEISENIVKFAMFNKYGVMPNWNTRTGDLIIDKFGINKCIEIKAFSSTGPSSFGPTEKWDWIYFVDARNVANNKFVVYELKLSNKSVQWQNLKINRSETYHDQCQDGKRPRLEFSKIKNQLADHFQVIFDGTLQQLANN